MGIEKGTRWSRQQKEIKWRYIKRAYAQDGYQVLLDRLWLRGVSKEKALQDLAKRGVSHKITLIYSGKDQSHNNAVVSSSA